jgi:dTDP-4-amino-4,6-dideoxygalactose transaminase
MMKNINVTKTFLPTLSEYEEYLQLIWDNNQITNNGPLLQELEERLKKIFHANHFQFLTNGTIALQLAIDGLGIKQGEIITTPFTYVATVNSILWQRCSPVFVDIDSETLCINPAEIEKKITHNTKAILPVHVFGNVCDVILIEKIASTYDIPVIYDASHAFGTMYAGKPAVIYGDIATLSFHATKLFHTIEGGGLVIRDESVNIRIDLEKRFGHNYYDHVSEGINAKASEFQAAMGLCNLKHLDALAVGRRKVAAAYDSALESMIISGKLTKMKISEQIDYNYAYYPIVFESEKVVLRIIDELSKLSIFPRRYFFPSLNTLPYLETYQPCPVSEDISRRILCLPYWNDVPEEIIVAVADVVKSVCNR